MPSSEPSKSMDDVGQSCKTDWTLTVIDEWLAYAKRAGKIDRGRSLLPDLSPTFGGSK